MPVAINFPAFTDDEVFLEDKEHANTFFGSITVPDATTISFGVVKRAAGIPVDDLTPIESAFTLDIYRVEVVHANGDLDYAELCDKTQVETALNSMRTVLISLINSLQSAGVLGVGE